MLELFDSIDNSSLITLGMVAGLIGGFAGAMFKDAFRKKRVTIVTNITGEIIDYHVPSGVELRVTNGKTVNLVTKDGIRKPDHHIGDYLP